MDVVVVLECNDTVDVAVKLAEFVVVIVEVTYWVDTVVEMKVVTFEIVAVVVVNKVVRLVVIEFDLVKWIVKATIVATTISTPIDARNRNEENRFWWADFEALNNLKKAYIK